MYACICVPGLPAGRHAALVRCAADFSPLIEPGIDRVLLDIRGLGSLMGRPREVAGKLKAALDQAGFPEVRIGIAANPHTAVTAARGFAGVTLIAPGDEARGLAPLPLSLLDADPELLSTLAAWGIHTFGDLSRLPEAGLAERLGPEGVRLHMLARGMSPQPLVAGEDEPDFSGTLDLEYSLDSLEPLAFLLARLLNEICGKLVSHGLAATKVTVRLALDDRAEHERSIQLPYATTDSSTLLKLLNYDLAAHPPHASIIRLTLIAEPSPQRRLQGGLFVPVAPEAEKLELTLARLAAVVGEGNVGSPELLNTHRADSFRVNRFVARADRPPKGGGEAIPVSPRLAIRLYRPPIPAQVLAPLGYPQKIVTGTPGIGGNVIGYAGPWRTSGDWWRTDSWARDEWDVALQSGALYRICREAFGRPAAGALQMPEQPPAGVYDEPAPPPDVITPSFGEPRLRVTPPWGASEPGQAPAPMMPVAKPLAGRPAMRWYVSGNYD